MSAVNTVSAPSAKAPTHAGRLSDYIQFCRDSPESGVLRIMLKLTRPTARSGHQLQPAGLRHAEFGACFLHEATDLT